MSNSLEFLVRRGLLIPWPVDLGPRDQPVRQVYGTGEFETWLESLPVVARKPNLLPPLVELEAAIGAFIRGGKLAGIINEISPPKASGILKLHTSNYRLFGWAALEPQTLILTHGAHSDEVHGGRGKRPKEYGRLSIQKRAELGVTKWRTENPHEIFQL